MKRRLWSILTVLALCVSMMPVGAAAVDEDKKPDNLADGATKIEYGDLTDENDVSTTGWVIDEVPKTPETRTTKCTYTYKNPESEEPSVTVVSGTITVEEDKDSPGDCVVTLKNVKMKVSGGSADAGDVPGDGDSGDVENTDVIEDAIRIGSTQNPIDVTLVLDGNGNEIFCEGNDGVGINVFGDLKIRPKTYPINPEQANSAWESLYVTSNNVGVSCGGKLDIDSSVLVCRTGEYSKAGIVAGQGMSVTKSEVVSRTLLPNDGDWRYGFDPEYTGSGGYIEVFGEDGLSVTASLLRASRTMIFDGGYTQDGTLGESGNGVICHWMEVAGDVSIGDKTNFTGIIEKRVPTDVSAEMEPAISGEEFLVYGNVVLTEEFARDLTEEFKKCFESTVPTFTMMTEGSDLSMKEKAVLDLSVFPIEKLDLTKGGLNIGGTLKLPGEFDRESLGRVSGQYTYEVYNEENPQEPIFITESGAIWFGDQKTYVVQFSIPGNENDETGTNKEDYEVKAQLVDEQKKAVEPVVEKFKISGWYRADDFQETDRWDFENAVESSMCLFGKVITNSGSGGSGSSRPNKPTTPTNPTTPTTPENVTVTPNATVSTDGSAASVTFTPAMGNDLVKKAVDNKSQEVIIAPDINGDVSKTEVTVPAAALTDLAGKTDAVLTVKTPVAQVTLPNEALSGLAKDGGEVTVTAEKTDSGYQLTVTANGQNVSSVSGGVTMTVPHDDCAPGTVAVLVKEDGTREIIRKSLAGEDSVTVPLDGSAQVELVDNSKSFQDVTGSSWEKDAVDFVSSHELFNGTSTDTFSPDTAMTRGMVAQVLHNLEGNPAQSVSGVFTDVDGNIWYAQAVSWAADQGIVSGYGDGQFGAGDSVSRQDLAVILFRYSGSPETQEKTLDFTDAGAVSDYAKQALTWAVEEGILNGKGGGVLDPKGQATRAQVAQMLLNYMAAQ